MELMKYKLERFVVVMAAIVPGLTAMWVYYIAVPSSYQWLKASRFFGERSPLFLTLLVAFVVGYTTTSVLSSFLGFIGGVFGSYRKYVYRAAHEYTIAPWRDHRWRIALKGVLGSDAPRDSHLLADEVVKLRTNWANQLAQPQRGTELSDLAQEKLQTEIDDTQWERWYDHYHHRVLLDYDAIDVMKGVYDGLSLNFAATGIYLLVSSIKVPELRHWWILIPAAYWVVVLCVQSYVVVRNLDDKWSSLDTQIKFLSQHREDNTAAAIASG